MTNTEIAKHDDMMDELLHLRRLNAELLAALEPLACACEKLPAFTKPGNVMSIGRLSAARSAIAKAQRVQS